MNELKKLEKYLTVQKIPFKRTDLQWLTLKASIYGTLMQAFSGEPWKGEENERSY